MTDSQVILDHYEDDDNDVPQLSIEAFKALQEFYAETEAQSKQIDENWVSCRIN